MTGGVWLRTPARGYVDGLPSWNGIARDELEPRGQAQPRPGIYAWCDYPGGPVIVVQVPSRWPPLFATRVRAAPRVHQVRRVSRRTVRNPGPGTRSWPFRTGPRWHAQAWCGLVILDPLLLERVEQAPPGASPCQVCLCHVRPA